MPGCVWCEPCAGVYCAEPSRRVPATRVGAYHQIVEFDCERRPIGPLFPSGNDFPLGADLVVLSTRILPHNDDADVFLVAHHVHDRLWFKPPTVLVGDSTVVEPAADIRHAHVAIGVCLERPSDRGHYFFVVGYGHLDGPSFGTWAGFIPVDATHFLADFVKKDAAHPPWHAGQKRALLCVGKQTAHYVSGKVLEILVLAVLIHAGSQL